MLIYWISGPILRMQIEFGKIRDVILFPIFDPSKVEFKKNSPLIVLTLAQQNLFYLITSIRCYGMSMVMDCLWPIKDVSLDVMGCQWLWIVCGQ
jgi:hypothetical protein